MPDFRPALTSRPAFEALASESFTSGRGVVIAERDGLGIAMLMSRKGAREALAERMKQKFGIELPNGPYQSASGDVAIAGTGPGTWLLTREQGGNSIALSLKSAVGDLASVTDQSDAYGVLRLTGPSVRDALCKLIPVDVHPRAFEVGDVAIIAAAHIGAILWRLQDQVDGSAVFEIAVPGSMAQSFWHALVLSAGEFGVSVQRRRCRPGLRFTEPPYEPVRESTCQEPPR